jgi:KUP system potassium uptake protein
MIITTVLTAFTTSLLAGRMRLGLMAALGLFFVLEIAFFAANLTKIAEGGWLPLALGAIIFLLLTTWKEGSALVAEERRRMDIPMPAFVAGPPLDVPRVPGTAVYLTSDPQIVPSALFHNLKHYKVMHERTIFLNVVGEEVPRVDEAARVAISELAADMQSVAVHFGFREEPDLAAALAAANDRLHLDPMTTTYFVARSSIGDGPGGLPRWRCGLFSWMNRQSESAASFFNLPANRVVELGTQILL